MGYEFRDGCLLYNGGTVFREKNQKRQTFIETKLKEDGKGKFFFSRLDYLLKENPTEASEITEKLENLQGGEAVNSFINEQVAEEKARLSITKEVFSIVQKNNRFEKDSYQSFEWEVDSSVKRRLKDIKIFLNSCKGSNKKLKTYFKKYASAKDIFNREYDCSTIKKDLISAKVGGINLTDRDAKLSTKELTVYKTSNYKLHHLSFFNSKSLQASKCSLYYLDSNALEVNGELNTDTVFIKIHTEDFKQENKMEFKIDVKKEKLLIKAPIVPCVSYNLTEKLTKKLSESSYYTNVGIEQSRRTFAYKVALYKKGKAVISRSKKEATYTIMDSTFTFDISSLGDFYFIYGMVILLDGTKILMYESYKSVGRK